MRVEHNLHDLSSDLAKVPVKAAKEIPKVVRRNAVEGKKLARSFARARSGPHGFLYYKRINAEMTGPYSAEYGPDGDPKTEFVGAGWRHGVNLDLPDSADIVGPKFAREVGDVYDGLLGD